MTYIYFVQAGKDGPIKIGYTSDEPAKRLAQLQTSNPVKLSLIGSISGSTKTEAHLHAELNEWRMQGEWFEPHPTVLATIGEALVSSNECCSFCLRTKDEVDLLIASAWAFICSGCVDMCASIIAEYASTVTSGPTSPSAPDVSAAVVVESSSATATAATQLPDEHGSDRPAERPVSRKIACAVHQGGFISVQGDRSPHQFKPER